MLSVHHLFDGTLRKEDVASGFLAMALEGLPRFRRHFIAALPPLAPLAADTPTSVNVEEKRIDVRVEVGDAVVLIENKVNPGALQTGQMLKYYERELRERPNQRVVCVFLAPGDMGRREVERVRGSGNFRASDGALHLSWERLFEYEADPADVLDRFVQEGLGVIRRVVEEARLAGPYGREGDRGRIRAMADTALRLILQERMPVAFHRWSAKHSELIRTKWSVVTVYVQARFDCGPEPDFAPQGIDGGEGRLALTLQSDLKLAGGLRKGSAVHQWWQAQLQRGEIGVPGIGRFLLDPVEGRFRWRERRVASDDDMAAAMAEIAGRTINVLTDLLKSQSLSLHKGTSAQAPTGG